MKAQSPPDAWLPLRDGKGRKTRNWNSLRFDKELILMLPGNLEQLLAQSVLGKYAME